MQQLYGDELGLMPRESSPILSPSQMDVTQSGGPTTAPAVFILANLRGVRGPDSDGILTTLLQRDFCLDRRFWRCSSRGMQLVLHVGGYRHVHRPAADNGDGLGLSCSDLAETL